MSTPNKERKDDTNKEPVELKAILPGETPPTVGEIFGDIDDYQKKIEQEWEQARNAYQEKIKKILDDFSTTSLPPEIESLPPKFSSEKITPKTPLAPNNTRDEDRLKTLLSQVEAALRKVDQKGTRQSF